MPYASAASHAADASSFFRLGNPLSLGAGRARIVRPAPSQHLPVTRSTERALLYGEAGERSPEAIVAHLKQNQKIVWTSWPGPVLVHRTVVERLRAAGVTGWTTVAVSLRDRAGVERPEFCGLGVTGRCERLSSVRQEDGSFRIETVRGWDGSDLFLPPDVKSFPLLSARAAHVIGAMVGEHDAAIEQLDRVAFDSRVRAFGGSLRWDAPDAANAWEWLVVASPAIRAAFEQEYGQFEGDVPGPYTVFGSFLSWVLRDLPPNTERGDLADSLRGMYVALMRSDDAELLEIVADSLLEIQESSGYSSPRFPVIHLRERALRRLHRVRRRDALLEPAVPLSVCANRATPRRSEFLGYLALVPDGPGGRVESAANVRAVLESASPFCGTAKFLQAIVLRLCSGSSVGDIVWPSSPIGFLPPVLSPSLDAALSQEGLSGWRTAPIGIATHDASILPGWRWMHAPADTPADLPVDPHAGVDDVLFASKYGETTFAGPRFVEVLRRAAVEPVTFGILYGDYARPHLTS